MRLVCDALPVSALEAMMQLSHLQKLGEAAWLKVCLKSSAHELGTGFWHATSAQGYLTGFIWLLVSGLEAALEGQAPLDRDGRLPADPVGGVQQGCSGE